MLWGQSDSDVFLTQVPQIKREFKSRQYNSLQIKTVHALVGGRVSLPLIRGTLGNCELLGVLYTVLGICMWAIEPFPENKCFYEAPLERRDLNEAFILIQ